PVPTGGGEAPPVGAERHAQGRALVPPEGEDLLAGRRVPQPHRPVPTGGGDAPPVGAVRHAVDPALVPPEGEDLLAGRRVPRSAPLPSARAEGRRRPRALDDTPLPRPWCPGGVRPSWPVPASHSRAVPSPPAEARRRPSALYDTPLTGPWCPRRVRTSWPVAAS